LNARTGFIETNNPGTLTNPIIAQHITGFCQAALGEAINQAHQYNWGIVSCTTDGFLCNPIKEHETEVEDPNLFKGPLAEMFKDSRQFITNKRDFLERKGVTKGVIS
jgi:hypothetical protein